MDIRITSHGSLILLHAETAEAVRWLEEHTAEDAMWHGNALVVEPRYAEAIVAGAREDGLAVV